MAGRRRLSQVVNTYATSQSGKCLFSSSQISDFLPTSSCQNLISNSFHVRTPVKQTQAQAPRQPNQSLVSFLSSRFWDEANRYLWNGSHRVPIPAVIDIWVDAAKKEAGVEAINLEDGVKQDMKDTLTKLFEAGDVDYEDFLNILVPLVLPKVSREVELDLANQMFDVYFWDTLDEGANIISSQTHLTTIQKIKIKASYQLNPGEDTFPLIRMVDNGGGDRQDGGNIFTLREFLRKMTNPPMIPGLGM